MNKKSLSQAEIRLMGVYPFLILFAFSVTPQLMATSLAVFINPATLFDLRALDLVVPFWTLFILLTLFVFYPKRKPSFRKGVWVLSAAYWSGWLVNLFSTTESAILHWIIWLPHLLLVLVSMLGLFSVKNFGDAEQ